MKQKRIAQLVDKLLQGELLLKINLEDTLLPLIKKSQETIALDLTINYRIPAHFKKGCLLINSIKMIANNPNIANLPFVISE